MTNQQQPLIPPSELVQKWASEWIQLKNINRDNFIVTRAIQWGSDQELEACCEWLDSAKEWNTRIELRAARRPKPPSLKEHAITELAKVDKLWDTEEFGHETLHSLDTIRRALEALPDETI